MTIKLKIISGGQTGVDRAALDVALDFHFPCGGWCPKGRRAEDGVIDKKYLLKETANGKYEIRTEANVRDSDATLIITHGKPRSGTAFTIAMARKHKKPCLIVDPGHAVLEDVRNWLIQNKVTILNIAGPRESNMSGIYKEAYEFLCKILT